MKQYTFIKIKICSSCHASKVSPNQLLEIEIRKNNPVQKYFLIAVRLEGRIDHLFIPRNAKAPDLDTATRVARYRKISRPSALSRRNELSSVLEPVG